MRQSDSHEAMGKIKQLVIHLFTLGLTSQSTFFSHAGRSHRFLCINQFSRELMCVAQRHNKDRKLDKLTLKFIFYTYLFFAFAFSDDSAMAYLYFACLFF